MTRIALLAACIALAAVPARANVILNGGFETGAFAPAWTVTGNGIAIDSTNPNTGTYDAAFSTLSTDPTPGVLSQTVATTPGQGYTLTFALVDQNISVLDSFTASFGTASVTITGDTTGGAYTTETLVIPGSDITGTSTALSFQGLIDPSQSNVWNLDDVSLLAAAVPEPPAAWLFGSALLIGLSLAAARRRTRGG